MEHLYQNEGSMERDNFLLSFSRFATFLLLMLFATKLALTENKAAPFDFISSKLSVGKNKIDFPYNSQDH